MDIMEGLKIAVSQSMDVANLVDGAKAKAILPTDTTFAIVAQIYALPASESTINSFSNNFELFWGYIAVSPDKLRIFRDGVLFTEELLPSVTAEYGIGADIKQALISVGNDDGVYAQKGGCVLKTKQYKLVPDTINPIVGEMSFSSSTTGFNDGLNPLFEALERGGATVSRPSTKSSLISVLIFFVLFVGFIAVIVILS
jgi:hypothetical protein